MNYLTLIIVGVLGLVLGVYFGRCKSAVGLVTGQTKKKMENKKKVLEYLQRNKKIQNNDVERLTGVSNATAERYLNELEKEGELEQHGKIGPSVFYTLR